MARISDYGNYETGKAQAEVEKFKETGVLPVSGKYTDSGKMTTKNVKLSDLVSGGAPVPTPTSADTGKVLTVGDSDSLVWDEVPSSQPNYGVGLVYDDNTDTLAFSYANSGGLEADHGFMQVKAGVGIELNNKGVNIDTRTATEGDVLTYHKNGSTDEIIWTAPGGGGGGGLSPISPTTITPTLENNTYKVAIPGNNAYYIATLNNTYNVEIIPPTIGANEMYNVVLFIVSSDLGDKQMTVDYNEYGIAPMDETSTYGWVYGQGFTQFVFLGRGFTMKTSAYSGG